MNNDHRKTKTFQNVYDAQAYGYTKTKWRTERENMRFVNYAEKTIIKDENTFILRSINKH